MKTSKPTLKDFNFDLECDACDPMVEPGSKPKLAIKSHVREIEDEDHVFVIGSTPETLEDKQFHNAFGYPLIETQFTFVPSVRCTIVDEKHYAICLLHCAVWTRNLLIDVVSSKKHRKSIIIGADNLAAIIGSADAASIEPFSFRSSDVIGRFLFLPSLPWDDDDYNAACNRVEVFVRKIAAVDETS